MSSETLNAFLTKVLDSEDLRLHLLQERSRSNLLTHLLQLAEAEGFDLTAADVVAYISPEQESTQGDLEIFALGNKLRLTWYPTEGVEQSVDFARPNDYSHIFHSTDAIAETLNPGEAILAIGFLVMVVDESRSPAEMQILENYLNQMGLDRSANQEVRRKIQRIYHEHGGGALFNAARAALTPQDVEAAFALATQVALADDSLMDEENDCLLALAEALQIDEDAFRRLIAGAVEQYSQLRQKSLPNLQLFESLVHFLQQENWSVQVPDQGTSLQTTYSGQNGSLVCLTKAREQAPQVVFYALCPLRVPADQRGAIAEFITRANYGLVIGNFEMNWTTGEVRFKTSLDVGDTYLSDSLIRPLVYGAVSTMDTYLPGIQAVLAHTSPEEAIAQVESSK
jgi:hypothetical protein